MKNGEKLFLIIFFIFLNLGAIFIISKFFNIGYGLLAGGIVCSYAAIDISQRRKQKKIKNREKKAVEEKRLKNQQERDLANKKREEAVKRQRRMTEHNAYRKGKR